MTYTAQELNTRVQFQRRTSTQDPNTGAMITAWTTYSEAFVRFDPLIGREFYAAQAEQGQHKAKITMRWRSGINVKDRIKARGADWDITSIQNIGSGNRELLLYVETLEPLTT